jgi:C-terminal processing protease CtpA/Prc
MKSKLAVLILLSFPFISPSQDPKITTEQYKEDFNYFWTTVNENYCYFNKKQTDWPKVKEIYLPVIDTITNRDQFVTILEKMFYEIYDHHANLNTNTADSRRLVPTSTDVWAEYINGKPLITEVRKGSGAEAAGIIAGMEVITVNDIAVQLAIKPFLARSLKVVDNEAQSFALRLLLAGNHTQPRKFTLKYKVVLKDYFPDKSGLLLENIKYTNKIDAKIIEGIGYIKINNCLFDNELIPSFDSAMQTMQNTKSLILDLRETPSGGNTTVARAILGWFIDKDHFYQKHELYSEERTFGIKRSWEEIVSPRKGKYYSKPLAILANHWTGSIGEGITIAFDALKRPKTTTIGTTLARLNGAGYTYEMPNTKINFSFPVERLYHINGLPREQYIPQLYIDLLREKINPGSDIFISKALQYLKSK